MEIKYILHAIKRRFNRKTYRERSHGQMIKILLKERTQFFGDNPIFVETGSGLSTISLAEVGKNINATIYSIDCNLDKVHELKAVGGGKVSSVHFLVGDSLASLAEIAKKHYDIHFLFLDSAASAMHTFREFMTAEKCLKPGACVLIDNAALPEEKRVLSPVRKGKILVPYLLASPFWEVNAHPRAGDSMVSGILHSQPDYAHFDYEHPEYIDNWRSLFEKELLW